MIGIIFSAGNLRGLQNIKHVEEIDNQHVLFYIHHARKNQVDVCFYRLRNLFAKTKKVKGYVYRHAEDCLSKQLVDIPQVNMNRTSGYLREAKYVQMIRKLEQNEGIIFFNTITNKERSKLNVHHYLQTSPKLQAYLPETRTLSFHSLIDMLEHYRQVFIKPKRGSKGKRIYIVEQDHEEYWLKHIQEQDYIQKKLDQSELRAFYQNRFSRPDRYIVQQGIPLKKYQGQKFDIRVSPQKNKKEKWQITGRIARIAAKGWDVTNLDQGGRSRSRLKPLLKLRTRKKIHQLSLAISHKLEQKYPQVNDLGLDFAVDENENIWFLEVNFRPLRKKAWLKRYRIPFQHACAVYKRLTRGRT